MEHVPQGVADVTRLGGRRALLQVWRRRAKTIISDHQKAGTTAKDSLSSSLSASWIDNDVNKW